jgi:hypothetical protein
MYHKYPKKKVCLQLKAIQSDEQDVFVVRRAGGSTRVVRSIAAYESARTSPRQPGVLKKQKDVIVYSLLRDF